MTKSLASAQESLEAASKQASSMQTEVISGSAITSINNATNYELVVLVILLCGLVMFNTIFLMMYLVGRITNRNIFTHCKTSDCTCQKQCGGLSKIRKRLPYVFYFNLFSILGVLIDCVIWYLDIRPDGRYNLQTQRNYTTHACTCIGVFFIPFFNLL